jgi:hypothetical protein
MEARCPDLEEVDRVLQRVKLLNQCLCELQKFSFESGREDAVLEEVRCGR